MSYKRLDFYADMLQSCTVAELRTLEQRWLARIDDAFAKRAAWKLVIKNDTKAGAFDDLDLARDGERRAKLACDYCAAHLLAVRFELDERGLKDWPLDHELRAMICEPVGV